MAVRISHCSTSLENYQLVLQHRVDGFPLKGPQPGDTMYLVVKSGDTTWCGARYVVGKASEKHPWKGEKKFPQRFALTEVEFCEPFDVSILRRVEPYYGVKYMQRSK